MAKDSFDPYQLRPLASLNRRRTISMPGIGAGMVGKTGWDLLSTQALITLIQPHVSELGLAHVDSVDLPVHLNKLLESSDGSVGALAASIAEQYGERLGCFIASLLCTSQGLTSPMVSWEEAYLKYWQEDVKEIVLGGGLSSGVFGKHIRTVAERVLIRCGIRHCRIDVSEYASYLPLMGAARNHPAGIPGSVAVFDFGGSWVKRGVAFYDEGQALYKLRVLPSCYIGDLTVPEKTAELSNVIIAIIAETIQKAGSDTLLAPRVLCSIAGYVEDGQPVKIERGVYTSFHHFSSDVTGWFSQKISNVLGQSVQVRFFRDGDVAACAYAGRSNAAIIMLGTALGAGFVPLGDNYRPLSNHFSLDEISDI